MITLYGSEVSKKIDKQIKIMMQTVNIIPKIVIIRIGDNPDDIAYETGATKKLKSLGITVDSRIYPENITNEAFQKAFKDINTNDDVNGILVLKPLPKHINQDTIDETIDPDKDLDGISPINITKIFSHKQGFAPCTAEAALHILKLNNIPLTGKNVVVVGRSMVVGRPLAMLLLTENTTVTICHSKTENLEDICRRADILISATGVTKLINHNHIKKDAVVIDIGINVDDHGHLCGDVDFEDIKDIASMCTPVPKGVGNVTTSILALHLLISINKNNFYKNIQ